MTLRRPAREKFGGDAVGIVIATVCLIHCVLVSLLAVLVPWFLSRVGAGRGLHQALAFLSLFMAVAILLPGFQIHQRRRVLALGGLGLALLMVGAWAPQDLCCNWGGFERHRNGPPAYSAYGLCHRRHSCRLLFSRRRPSDESAVLFPFPKTSIGLKPVVSNPPYELSDG